MACTSSNQTASPKSTTTDTGSIILLAISEGTDVCVAIDANESLDTSNQHFQEWIAECGLISAHENFYDEEYYDNNKIPTTCQNSSTKINHVFCTPRLFGCITRVAIEPLHDGIFSDHRALIVDFDTGKLLGHAIPIAKPKTRLLTSTQKKPIQNTAPHSTANYKRKMYTYELQSFWRCIQQQNLPPNGWKTKPKHWTDT
jgi:hypothetical protein